jgi:cytochrome c-type biogenesis protein CcmE
MMPVRKRRRVQVLALAAGALALSAGLIGWGLRDGIAFFRSPSEVAAAPPAPAELFRIGGLVEAGSVVRGQGETVSFRVTDGAVTIPVTFTGVLPDLFAECEASVAMGRYDGSTFTAVEVLAKHDETYTPREVGGSLAQGARNACDDLAAATPGAPGTG